MALVSTKALVTVDQIGSSGDTAGSNVNGRVDVRKEINEINFVATFTDQTIAGFESAPRLPEAIVTADKRINDKLSLALGYDAGVNGTFVSLTGDSNVSNKDVRATATWFQKGGQVRTEASVNLDGRSSLWGTYTFNDASDVANSTYVNLRQREGYVISPFTVPVATSAVKYSLAKDDYLIEAAVDLNQQAPFLSVQRKYGRQTYKAHYSVKDEYAMIETGYAQTDGDLPLIKGYVKGPLGTRGLGPLSVGLIFDKTLDL